MDHQPLKHHTPAAAAMRTKLRLCFSQTTIRLMHWKLPLNIRLPFGSLLKAFIASLAAWFRGGAAVQLEILALRPQIGVLQRSVKRPKLTPVQM